MPNGIDEETELIADLINGFRIANGKGPLFLDRHLTLGARSFSLSRLAQINDVMEGKVIVRSVPKERDGWNFEIVGFGKGKDAQEFAKELVLSWIGKDEGCKKQILDAAYAMGIGFCHERGDVFITLRMR
ncbi:MAG TPA: hypothetical protein HA254_03420 [Candidatus Diapherotrites archaeon]|uniref:Uncharacterized protein n=1 Tax=Candidatus Iainarchaeum sp. TaxID=3101447 RepID=A0A7J4IW01_9ARCH|nr:hypothetical protein [Candidatus Diapherotrites archaeon]